jgi:guanylate kinase
MSKVTTLEQAHLYETTYQPSQSVKDALQNKSLVMIVGPVAVGKTFIMDTIASMSPAFRRVSTFTTREQRSDDGPNMFRYISGDQQYAELLEKLQSGGLVQYAIHPASHQLYGSELQDYPGEYNLLATLSNVVEYLSRLPFKHTYVVGLVCRADTWEAWLTRRYPTPSEEKQQRLQEAISCLEWFIKNDVILIENTFDQPQKSAQDVIDAILYNKGSDKAKQLAHDMLEKAKELL